MRRLVAGSATVAVVALATAARADVTHPFPGMTVVHHPGESALVVMDLCAPGASVRATKYEERQARPDTWAQSLDLEAAVNGDFFEYPGWTWVIGPARGDGVDWPPSATHHGGEIRPYWEFGPGVTLGVADGNVPIPAEMREVVGGHNVIVLGGKTTGPWSDANDGALLNGAYRRTGVGTDVDRRWFYMISTDTAMTAQGLVDTLLAEAAEGGAPPVDFATNQDGGGSSQLYVKGMGQIISTATGREVANHFGLRAKGAGPAPNCVAKYKGDYVAQSYPPSQDPPVQLAEGESVDGWIELRNTGTATWIAGETKLAPIPRDQPSPLGATTWLQPNRVSTVDVDVPPGAVGHFAVRLTGNAQGDYLQHFGLVEELVTWFADLPLGGGPPDDFLTVHVVVGPAQASTSAGAGGAGAVVAGAGGSGGAGGSDGAHPGDSGGCGCKTSPGDGSGAWIATLASFALAARRRRRVSVVRE